MGSTYYLQLGTPGGPGTWPWANVDRITDSDPDNFASATKAVTLDGDETDYLDLFFSGWGLIPGDVTILGLQVDVTHALAKTSGDVAVSSATLYDGGAVGDSQHTATSLDATFGTFTYGGPTAQWGTTLTAAIIQSPTLSFRLRYISNGVGANLVAKLQSVVATIYTDAGIFKRWLDRDFRNGGRGLR